MASNIPLTYAVRIPQNIDLDTLLLLHPINGVPNAKDYLLYILSLIQNNFRPLNSTKLQKIVDNYSPLLNWLIDRGIVECDGIYKQQQKSKGYKFAPNYVTEFKEELIFKKTLIKKITRSRATLNDVDVPKNEELLIFQVDSFGYGYEATWVTKQEVARELNLKPQKMVEGLRNLGLIDSPNDDNTQKDSSRDYYYLKYNVLLPGNWVKEGHKLFFNDFFIPTIKAYAENFPLCFPKKTKIS